MENKTCMILLIGLRKAMHCGKTLMSLSMVKYQRGIPLPGNTPSTMSGFTIHALYYTISLGILISQTSWILPPRKFATRMVNVDMRTLCQLIGHGGRRYVFRCLRTHIWINKSDDIDNRMTRSLRRIQKTMERHFVLLYWEATRQLCLLPPAKLNTIRSIFQMV